MRLKTRVIEKNGGQVLFECDPVDADLAYIKASEYEEMGLDVRVEQPGVNQTLAASLGVEGPGLEVLQDSLAEELEDHPGSCCFDDNAPKH